MFLLIGLAPFWAGLRGSSLVIRALSAVFAWSEDETPNGFRVNSVARGDMSALKLSSMPMGGAAISMTVVAGDDESSRDGSSGLGGGNGCVGAILRLCGYEKFCGRFRVGSSAIDEPMPRDPNSAALSSGEW